MLGHAWIKKVLLDWSMAILKKKLIRKRISVKKKSQYILCGECLDFKNWNGYDGGFEEENIGRGGVRWGDW